METNLCQNLCNETSIDMLLRKGLISVRAYNTCHRIGIHNIGELLAVHLKEAEWMHIHRCGPKTTYELTSLIVKLRNSQAA